MLETLRWAALNRCPVRAWHAVQISSMLRQSHFSLLRSYRIFFREKILVVFSTTKLKPSHLMTCCCIMTSTGWELPTDQVHAVAKGHAVSNTGLVSMLYSWQSIAWGYPYTDSLGQGSPTPQCTTASRQNRSNMNYSF